MEKQRLLETLTDLRAELSEAEGVDRETLDRLDQLIAEAERGVAPTDDPERISNSESTGLKDILLKFEGDHPQLSASIGRVADALAAMGF